MSRIRRHAALALTLACLVAGGRAGAQPAARADDATFVLLALTQDGRPAALGTAFFIDGDGTALTNSHVVYLARQHPERYRLLAVVGREFYSAVLVCASRLAYDPATDTAVVGRDVAEIKLGPSRFTFTTYVLGGVERTAHLTRLPAFPALRLGGDPTPGAAVRIVGFGLVAEQVPPTPGVRWTATGTVDDVGAAPDGTPVFRVVSTNGPRKGNSGSPVLDAAGQVVGIWTWNSDENLAFGFAIGSSALARPCGTSGAAGPIGPAAVTPR
ncbi:MAG TPA: serine protease [bacterium]|nr:serine protease [bacterium]